MKPRTKRILVVLGIVFVLGVTGIAWVLHYYFSPTATVRVVLAGHTPSSLRELHVQEDAWTDYVARVYFRCDPASLRRILEQPPFERDAYPPSKFSFDQTPFEDLQNQPEIRRVITFDRTDLEAAKGSCYVYTDAEFSFAYIEYSVE